MKENIDGRVSWCQGKAMVLVTVYDAKDVLYNTDALYAISVLSIILSFGQMILFHMNEFIWIT